MNFSELEIYKVGLDLHYIAKCPKCSCSFEGNTKLYGSSIRDALNKSTDLIYHCNECEEKEDSSEGIKFIARIIDIEKYL